MAFLSIIIPIYNKEAFLKAAIDSVLNQSYQDFELILVNDGSTDNSGQICEAQKLLDSRIIVLHQDNKGVSQARNAGLQQATGAFIGFIDGDDTIEPSMYATLINNAITNNADISICSIKIFYPNKIVDENAPYLLEIFNKEQGISAVLKGSVGWSANNKIYESGIAKKIKFEGKVNEDLLYVFNVFLEASKSIHQNVLLYNYIKRNNSVSMSFNRTQMESVEVSKKILDVVSDKMRNHLSEAKLLDFISNISILNLIILSSKQNEFKEYDQIVKTLQAYSEFVKKSGVISKKHRIAHSILRINPTLYAAFIKVYSKIFYTEAGSKL